MNKGALTTLAQRRLLTKSISMGLISPWAASSMVSLAAADEGVLAGARELSAYLSRDDQAIALVMLSLPNCPVCKIVRRQQLLPLTRDDNYRDIGIFEVMMTNDSTALPFAGKLNPEHSRMTPRSFARMLGIRVSPSLVFLSRNYMLAEPLIGYPSPDYYWGYLSERIEAARAAISMTS
ncbi:MAG: hypothetical protein AB8C46_08540 [Burkholderiaceae bacterium]